MVDNDALLPGADRSVVHFADADSADIFIVINGADQHLCARFGISFRSGNIVYYCLKQRLHAGSGTSQIQSRDAGLSGRENEGTVDLFIAGAQVHQQLEHFIDHLSRSRAGTVDLVDADNNGQIQSHGLGEDKTGLRHRTFEGVHDQDDTVDHLQNTFDLAAEVSVSGCIHDIDLCTFIIDSSVFAQDGDTPLSLEIVGIHDSLLHCLIFTKDTALLQQAVHQGGLAVIDMGNDRYVSNIFSSFLHVLNTPDKSLTCFVQFIFSKLQYSIAWERTQQ